MKKLLIIAMAFVFSFYSKAQKVNPDLDNIQVKNKSSIVYKTDKVINFKHVKLAIDSKGNLSTVFHDPYNGNAYFATNKSGEWKTEVLITKDKNGYDAAYPAIAIDKNDKIHVVFTRHPSALIYGTKKVSDSKWTFSEINNDNTPKLFKFYVWEDYIDMCTDNKGGVHLIISGDGRDLQEKIFDMAAMYFYKSANGKWENEIIKRGITDTYKGYGTDPSIVTYNNNVMVSFGGKNSINFAQKTINGNKWNIKQIKIDNDMNGGKQNTSLCLSPDGTPAFAYRDLFGGDDYQGLNVVTRNPCNGNWYIDKIGNMKKPAMGVDKNGVMYLAYGNGWGLSFAYRTCNCEQAWKKVYDDRKYFVRYTDMVIDNKNHVHVLYASEKEIVHTKFWFEGNPEIDCNYRPNIYFKVKTNVKPGEEWSAKIYANDPECDPVEIYSIILPNGYKLIDHGNGSATLKGTVGLGEGEMQMLVLCNDNKHPGSNGQHSTVTITLRVTNAGEEKGSVKYKNNCKPVKSQILKTGKSEITSSSKSEEVVGESTKQDTYETKAKDDEGIETDSKLDPVKSKTCEDYLNRYEAWADKYVPLKTRVNENPMDMDAVMKIANMAAEIGNFALEWSQLHECGNDEGFQARYESITDRIDEVNK